MTKEIKLNVEMRIEKKAKETRSQGYIPAVLYGADKKAQNIKIKEKEFDTAYKEVGESGLVELAIDGQGSMKAMVKEAQKDPIKGKIIHVDFYKVDMKKKIEVEIPLVFVNESKAVKEMEGTLVKSVETLHVSCLPGDLLESISVDISVLNDFSDHIRVKDLQLPETIEVMNNPDDVIASVARRKVEAEPVKVEAEAKDGVAGEAKVEAGKEGEAGVEAKEKKKEEKK